jgi:hypothetical protein
MIARFVPQPLSISVTVTHWLVTLLFVKVYWS